MTKFYLSGFSRLFICFAFVLTIFSLVFTVQVKAQTNCSQGTTLNIVAHYDDDILFLDPDLFHDIQAGRCIVTLFVTAGDANGNSSYWHGREDGAKAANAYLAGVSDSWIQSDAGITNHPIPVFTLLDASQISLLFMHLPDGGMDGSGFPNNQYASLQKLWQGTINQIGTVDNSSTYTKDELIDTLVQLIIKYQPDKIRTQNYVDVASSLDHSDHYFVSYFAHLASQQYFQNHSFIGYYGYEISFKPANVAGNDLITKQNAFFAYAQHDPNICQTLAACQQSGYASWFERQYIVGQEEVVMPTPTPVPLDNNIAPDAVVSASSENPSTNQQAVKAVDRVADGYPADYTHEWATTGEGTGAYLQLTWTVPHTINKIVLYDRPNLVDQITAGTITFSDGTSISTGSLNNDGSALVLTFTEKSVTSIRFAITSVSDTTANVGLAEIQVNEIPGSLTPTPTPVPLDNNIAPDAVVSASSENPSTNQQAVKAVDRVADGYPADYTHEWATTGEGTGAYLQLTWTVPHTINKIVLYDRPNLVDQITAGTITFSDGTSISTGSLNNDGSALVLTFTEKSVTSIRFAITSVSDTTANVGLAEIQVNEIPGSLTPTPTPVPLDNNIAPDAVVSASSENPSTNQQAVKAVDRVADGYPADYTHEWATTGEGTGAYLQLTWTVPHTINKIVLYDRPNLVDQITAGTITFSDGTSISTGSLNNDGSALVLTFTEKSVTSIRFAITGVSDTTANTGLAEIQIFSQ